MNIGALPITPETEVRMPGTHRHMLRGLWNSAEVSDMALPYAFWNEVQAKRDVAGILAIDED